MYAARNPIEGGCALIDDQVEPRLERMCEGGSSLPKLDGSKECATAGRLAGHTLRRLPDAAETEAALVFSPTTIADTPGGLRPLQRRGRDD
ncbi:hypothetical protein [Candidatus Amarobacter glycogenicus]|uniref:hypothetical protein n=1 Tax=Candidatus Amarobacter glycogenicus TaxID=3140699 RepID=UPI002A11C47E|nr:hypothetical protein [Dehalococcoidia bacterium]